MRHLNMKDYVDPLIVPEQIHFMLFIIFPIWETYNFRKRTIVKIKLISFN